MIGLRPRLTTVLAALALVLGCAVALRLSEPRPPYEIVRGDLGEPVQVNGGTVTVDALRVGSGFEDEYGTLYSTDGMFVVLRVTVAATGRLELRMNNAQLTAEERTYDVVSSPLLVADPGFATTADVGFEVDPTRVADLTVEVWDAELISGYPQRVRVPLGITDENAAAWVDGGRGATVRQQPSSERGLP